MKPTASDRMTDSVLAIAPLPWLICVSLDREHVTSAHTLFPDTRVVLGFVCFWALADAIRCLSADSGRAEPDVSHTSLSPLRFHWHRHLRLRRRCTFEC